MNFTTTDTAAIGDTVFAVMNNGTDFISGPYTIHNFIEDEQGDLHVVVKGGEWIAFENIRIAI